MKLCYTGARLDFEADFERGKKTKVKKWKRLFLRRVEKANSLISILRFLAYSGVRNYTRPRPC